MLAVEDAIFALEWAKALGGLDGPDRARATPMPRRSTRSSRSATGSAISPPIRRSRSKTSVCLTRRGRRRADFIKKFAGAAREAEGAAYDIAGYRDAPPGLRIWCGATVDTADIEALGPWLDWAYAAARRALALSDPRRPRRRPELVRTARDRPSTARIPAFAGMTKFRRNRPSPKSSFPTRWTPTPPQIFRERGVEVDEITGKTPDELKAIIGQYDGLAIRSRDQGDQGDPRRRDQSQGDRPRRHRRRQCRHPRRLGQGRRRDEHAVRQFDHHRRARHRADVRARPPAARGRRLDPGRQVGEEPLHGRRGHRQDARPDRRGQYRLDRRRSRARPAR